MGYDVGGRTALVTGGSSGIGAAVGRELAARGAEVALVARREGRLARVAEEIRSAGGTALPVPGDVTDDASVAGVLDRVREELGPVDVLVNNAGSTVVAPVEETPVEEAEALFDVNVLGMLRTVRRVVPRMRRRGSGVVVQMSSVSGIKALPVNGVYSATKAAVARLTEALRQELEGTGVQVHCVYPVGTRTGLLEASRDHVGTEASQEFFVGPLTPVHEPEDVAEATVRGIEKNRLEIYPLAPVRFLRPLNALAPRLVETVRDVRAYRDRVLESRG